MRFAKPWIILKHSKRVVVRRRLPIENGPRSTLMHTFADLDSKKGGPNAIRIWMVLSKIIEKTRTPNSANWTQKSNPGWKPTLSRVSHPGFCEFWVFPLFRRQDSEKSSGTDTLQVWSGRCGLLAGMAQKWVAKTAAEGSISRSKNL